MPSWPVFSAQSWGYWPWRRPGLVQVWGLRELSQWEESLSRTLGEPGCGAHTSLFHLRPLRSQSPLSQHSLLTAATVIGHLLYTRHESSLVGVLVNVPHASLRMFMESRLGGGSAHPGDTASNGGPALKP